MRVPHNHVTPYLNFLFLEPKQNHLTMIRIILITALSFCTLHIGFAQTFDKEKLDNYLEALEANDKFMGSVAIAKNGEVIYTKATGFADVESKKKPDANTKYRIGSISKTFTATLVLKAVEENKLSLDQTIHKYFPLVTNAKKITISNLLNHRSGIHNFTNDDIYLEYNTKPKTEADMVAIIAEAGSDFEPDSKAEYSNSNYVLLSYILQKVYDQSYSDILDEKIIKPANLKNTKFGGKIDLSKNECNSYEYVSSWEKQPETDMSVPMGAGAIISTPSDLTQFAFTLFSRKIISAESVKTMTTIKDGYGMGLFTMPFGDKTSYGHTGGIDGFSSIFGYFEDDKVAFAITSNGNNYNHNNVSIAVLSAVFNEPYEIPLFKSIEVSSADLDKYLGVYSSPQIPLKVTITKSENTLVAQATGQPSFPLQATAEHQFSFDKAGVVLDFNPEAKQMTLNQGGGSYVMTRE